MTLRNATIFRTTLEREYRSKRGRLAVAQAVEIAVSHKRIVTRLALKRDKSVLRHEDISVKENNQ